MPVITRVQVRPMDIITTKEVFVSAVRFAMSIAEVSPVCNGELKTSAQEQVEYMLGSEEDTPFVIADNEVKSVVRQGILKVLSLFERELASLLAHSSHLAEAKVLKALSDVEWTCNILPKMNMMKEFVWNWTAISLETVRAIEKTRLMWGLKVKLIEITGKVLEAVGYGNVAVSAIERLKIVRVWLPFIQKIKPVLESKGHKMDDESIEGSLVSLVLALPSDDQAYIFAEWMKQTEELVRYPDLTEAFEIWCHRTKSAKRRLLEGCDYINNPSIDLS